MAFVHPSRRALVPKSPFDPLAVVFLPHLPLRRTLDSQVPTERVTEGVDDHRGRNEAHNSDRDRGQGGRRDRSRDHRAPYSERDRDDEQRRDRGRSREREEHQDRDHRSNNGDRHDGRREKMPRTAGREEEEHGLRETIALLSGPPAPSI